jgi:hypothetical protein
MPSPPLFFCSKEPPGQEFEYRYNAICSYQSARHSREALALAT